MITGRCGTGGRGTPKRTQAIPGRVSVLPFPAVGPHFVLPVVVAVSLLRLPRSPAPLAAEAVRSSRPFCSVYKCSKPVPSPLLTPGTGRCLTGFLTSLSPGR